MVPKPRDAESRIPSLTQTKLHAQTIASEQVMKAKVAENRANLVLAEAEVPKAMAKAFVDDHFQATTSAIGVAKYRTGSNAIC